MGGSRLWVAPSSSARCSNFPRMSDKLHFYLGLRKYLELLKDGLEGCDLEEFRFQGKCAPSIPSTSKMWRRKEVSAFLYGGRIANKDTFGMDDLDVVKSTEFVLSQEDGRTDEEKSGVRMCKEKKLNFASLKGNRNGRDFLSSSFRTDSLDF